MKIKHYVVYILLAVLGIGAGISAAGAFAYYRSYTLVKSELVKMQLPERRDQIALLQRHLMLYGIVESVGPEDETLTVRLQDQFVATAEPVTFLIYTEPNTKIVEQRLLAENKVYAGLSEEPREFSDIRPGMRIAMLVENMPEEGKIVARLILFGNPL